MLRWVSSPIFWFIACCLVAKIPCKLLCPLLCSAICPGSVWKLLSRHLPCAGGESLWGNSSAAGRRATWMARRQQGETKPQGHRANLCHQAELIFLACLVPEEESIYWDGGITQSSWNVAWRHPITPSGLRTIERQTAGLPQAPPRQTTRCDWEEAESAGYRLMI